MSASENIPASSVFATTHWSLISRAGKSSREGRAALEALCRAYWFPVSAFARKQGCTAADAEDVTQDFFAEIVQSQFLQRADANRGRFRSYLLTAVKRRIVNAHDHASAQKRGGGMRLISIDEPLSYGKDSATRLWDTRTGDTILVLPGFGGTGVVEFSRDGSRAGLSGIDLCGVIMKVTRPTAVPESAATRPHDTGSLVGALDFTADGARLVAATWGGVEVFDFASGDALASFPVPKTSARKAPRFSRRTRRPSTRAMSPTGCDGIARRTVVALPY